MTHVCQKDGFCIICPLGFFFQNYKFFIEVVVLIDSKGMISDILDRE
jgi:hypothetical protein